MKEFTTRITGASTMVQKQGATTRSCVPDPDGDYYVSHFYTKKGTKVEFYKTWFHQDEGLDEILEDAEEVLGIKVGEIDDIGSWMEDNAEDDTWEEMRLEDIWIEYFVIPYLKKKGYDHFLVTVLVEPARVMIVGLGNE